MPAMKDPTAAETDSSVSVVRRLVFLNGAHEIDIGDVPIRPGFDFRRLRILASDRIGVPEEQISVFLAHQGKKTAKRSAIDENTDFASLVRTNRDFVFQVMWKKDSRGRITRNHAAANSYFPREKKPPQPPPEKTILKRPSDFQGLMGPFNYRALTNLQQQREKYLVSTAPAARHPYPGSPPSAPLVSGPPAAGVCEVCSSGKETRVVAFHFCVHDRILVEAFRSPVGPIQKPLAQATPFSLLS